MLMKPSLPRHTTQCILTFSLLPQKQHLQEE